MYHIKNLDKIFNPKRIVVFGFTQETSGIANRVLWNLISSGFDGVVYPICNRFESVMSIPSFPNVESLPNTPDLAVICSKAQDTPAIVEKCGEFGIKGIIIMSAGFREIGENGEKIEDDIRQLLTKYDGMRIIGPNCLGIINPHLNLNVSFSKGIPKKGNIAFISQSGALCTSVIDWALQKNIGFSQFVSIGNTMDIDFGDLIEYFNNDEHTEAILLYVESIAEAREFMSSAKRFSRHKPIIGYKAGRFPESADAATSHTGAMAAEDSIYNAAFERAGIVRVYNIDELIDIAELIGRRKTPKGHHLGIVTNAGGPGVMAADTLIATGGRLARLSKETMDILDEKLPTYWSKGNPVDVQGDADADRIEYATKAILDDPYVDAVLVILTPQAMTEPIKTAEAIGKLSQTTDKTLMAAWMGGFHVREGIEILTSYDVATYTAPEQAVKAYATLVKYQENIRELYRAPGRLEIKFPAERNKLRQRFGKLMEGKNAILSEDMSKTLLESYGIEVTRPHMAVTPEAAAKISDYMGYPVVLKVLSPDIVHKSEVGGVALNLKNSEEVKFNYNEILDNTRKNRPDARIDGVTVQPNVDTSNGVEMIVGLKHDPVFGMVIMVGMGGTAAELFLDTRLGFPPLTDTLARRMIYSLNVYPLLRGYRGHPQVSIDSLVETLIRMSYLATDYPEIREMDVNPLLVTPRGCIALDGRIFVDTEVLTMPQHKYIKYAIVPYPEQYTKIFALPNGDDVKIRAIRPEDELMFSNFLKNCSKKSLKTHFGEIPEFNNHDFLVDHCHIDYALELGMVAENVILGEKRIIGCTWLKWNSYEKQADFSMFVSDEHVESGLYEMLYTHTHLIAKVKGFKKLNSKFRSSDPVVTFLGNNGFHMVDTKDGDKIELENII